MQVLFFLESTTLKEGIVVTNVPQDLRNMWTDIYVLFDVHYNMPNTAEAWLKFWERAEEIRQKHNCPHVGALILIDSEMIEYHLTGKMLHKCTLEDMNLF